MSTRPPPDRLSGAASKRWLAATGVFVVAFVVASPATCSQSAPPAPAPPPVREIAPGVFQIGKVRLEKAARTVSFPATLNMTNGPLEYLLVTPIGKTHESLLKTDVEPHHIHVAMLLLGAKGAQAKATNAPSGGPATAASLAPLRDKPMPGEAVSIEIAWKSGAKNHQRRIEELVLNTRAKAAMTRGDFVFNGSLIWQGAFVAQQEGSIIAAITDPGAIFNNPRPGRDEDDAWTVLSKEAPPLDTPVTVTIKLTPQPPARP
ncbi:MAG: hypothetical protein FJ386_05035 [Verrucomicrobia bacterium]|nr:hypothetical protein [Verrucomicrobiota bacterium]